MFSALLVLNLNPSAVLSCHCFFSHLWSFSCFKPEEQKPTNDKCHRLDSSCCRFAGYEILQLHYHSQPISDQPGLLRCCRILSPRWEDSTGFQWSPVFGSLGVSINYRLQKKSSWLFIGSWLVFPFFQHKGDSFHSCLIIFLLFSSLSIFGLHHWESCMSLLCEFVGGFFFFFFYFAMCNAALYDGGLFVFQGRH